MAADHSGTDADCKGYHDQTGENPGRHCLLSEWWRHLQDVLFGTTFNAGKAAGAFRGRNRFAGVDREP